MATKSQVGSFNMRLRGLQGCLVQILAIRELTPEERTGIQKIVDMAFGRMREDASRRLGMKFTPPVPYHFAYKGKRKCEGCGAIFGKDGHDRDCVIPEYPKYQQFLTENKLVDMPRRTVVRAFDKG